MADGLKSGVAMKPQLFVEASVSFVVIYNFAVIVSKMTPVQTVDLVNHLWITFDEVTAKHNVYKVGHPNHASLSEAEISAYTEVRCVGAHPFCGT